MKPRAGGSCTRLVVFPDHEQDRLARFWPGVLASLFLISWAWRLFFLERLARSPLSGSLNADARIYWEWAGSLLHDGLSGKNPFFFGPLYPYVLVGLRAAFGDSVGAVLHVQALWGAAAVVLIADAARRLTTPLLGAAVGLLLAGYEMAVFFDGQVLMESLLFCLEALLLWLVVRTDWHAPRVATLTGLGIVIGVLAQGRATATLLVIPVALAIHSATGRTWRSVRRVGLVVAACVTTMIPSIIHNRVVSGEWIPFTYNLGYNLYVGNNPEATGSFVVTTGTIDSGPAFGDRSADGGAVGDGRAYLRSTYGLDLSPSQSSNHWARQALAFASENPARAARLAVQKVCMFWNRREYGQIESIELFRAALGPIGLPAVGTFLFLGVLAFAGWGAMWSKGPTGRFVVGYVLILTASIAPFFVTDRYRLHLVPGVALLAVAGMDVVARSLKHHSWPQLARSGAMLLVGAMFIGLPMPRKDSARVRWDVASDLGEHWLEKGRPDVALSELATATEIDEAGQLRGSETVTARLARAAVFGDHATALRQLNHTDQAVSKYERAYQLAPSAERGLALASAYSLTGQFDLARKFYAQSGLAERAAAAALIREAVELNRKRRWVEVEHALESATILDPTQTIAWVALIRLQVQLGHLGQAQNTLLKARDAGLSDPAYYAHTALIAAARGDLAESRRALTRVSQSARDSDPTLTDVLVFVQDRLGSQAGGRRGVSPGR